MLRVRSWRRWKTREPGPLPELPRLPYVRLRVTLRAEERASVPAYHGSMLRGAFGHALRRTVCVMGPAQPCATCSLRPACVYPRLFETFLDGSPPPFLRGLTRGPCPYVFEPLGTEGTLAPGDSLAFDLLLIGQAVDLQGYAALALERMARGGLRAGRGRFRLERVETIGPSLPPLDGLPPGPLTLRFVTPLRLKVRDHLVAQPGFRDLVFAMLRRTLELAQLHVPGARVEWELRPWLERAEAVRVARADLRWHDWERYSHRQQSRMKLGGVMGTLVLEGDLAPFAPLLRAAEVVHVGKGATFGLGKVELG